MRKNVLKLVYTVTSIMKKLASGLSPFALSPFICARISPVKANTLNISAYNCTVYRVETDSPSLFSLIKSTVTFVYASASSQLWASDSSIEEIYTYEKSCVRLVDSTYTSCSIFDQSTVFVCWYLDVHVIDSIDQDVPYANVTAAYSNATLAETKLTNAQGWTRLSLTEKMMNAAGKYPIGNYTVEAVYGSYSNRRTVNMTGKQQITITLEDLVVPEFQSILMLSLFIIATLLVAVIYKRRHYTKSESSHK